MAQKIDQSKSDLKKKSISNINKHNYPQKISILSFKSLLIIIIILFNEMFPTKWQSKEEIAMQLECYFEGYGS